MNTDIREIEITLWGQKVGRLAWDGDLKAASFRYDRGFLQAGIDIAPLTMPLAESDEGTVYRFPENRNACFKGLPGLFADMLPDNFGTRVTDEWFASQGIDPESVATACRLAFVGTHGMGALEFAPAAYPKFMDESAEFHFKDFTRIVNGIFSGRDDFRRDIRQGDAPFSDIVRAGSSAGGAKPKAVVAFNETTGEMRCGQVPAPQGFGYWLLKFEGVTFSEHKSPMSTPEGLGNIEYAYHKMARDCGIDMTECRLLPAGRLCHFMTKRFDRDANGNKLLTQTLAGMAHLNREERHSYEEMFDIMGRLRLDYGQFEQLFRRTVFNIMGRNHDDHTKNHSFIMNRQGQWRLAPAYDLCYAYKPDGTWTIRHQMSANGKREDFTADDLIAVGEKAGITRPKEIVGQIADVFSRWTEYAKDCGVRDRHREQIRKNLLLLH